MNQRSPLFSLAASLPRLRSKLLGTALAIALSSTAVDAAQYVDIFDREELGPDWTHFVPSIPPPSILYPYGIYLAGPADYGRSLSGYTGVTLTDQFEVALVAQVHINLGGVAFNIQDADNFYALRAWWDQSEGNTLVQLFKRVDGVDTGLASVRGAAISPDQYYWFSVSTTGDGMLNYAVTELGGGVIGSGSYEDTLDPLSGGYAGILVDGNYLAASYFSVLTNSTIPEPSSVVLLISAGGLLMFSLTRSRKPLV